MVPCGRGDNKPDTSFKNNLVTKRDCRRTSPSGRPVHSPSPHGWSVGCVNGCFLHLLQVPLGFRRPVLRTIERPLPFPDLRTRLRCGRLSLFQLLGEVLHALLRTGASLFSLLMRGTGAGQLGLRFRRRGLGGAQGLLGPATFLGSAFLLAALGVFVG